MLRVFLLLIFMFLLLCLPAFAADIGDMAPPVKVERWLQGSEEPVQLDDGKLRVLEFWATWCAPCLETAPLLSELQKKYAQYPFEIIGVSNQRPEDVLPFLEEVAVNYRIGVDDDDQTFEAYLDAVGIDSIPYSFLVGGDGKILWHGHPQEGLDEMIAAVVEGRFDLQTVLDLREAEQRIGRALDLLEIYEYLRSDLEELELADLLVQRVLDYGENDPHFLTFVALVASTRQGDLSTARRAFQMALDHPDGQRPDLLLAYSEVLKLGGALEQAQEMKQKAQALVLPEVLDEAAMVDSLIEYLEDYRDLLAL